jgi:micrococcal nuclease
MERPVPSSRRDALFVLVMATFLLLPAAACSLAWGHGARPSPSPPGQANVSGLRPNGSITAVVTSTVDGDTVHVRVGGREEKVRFIGVDTPEVDWYGGEGQCDGVPAALYTRQRLSGGTVRLDFDVRLRDVYGRLLAYVYVGSELFNLTLVKRGLATNDPVPPDTRMETTFAGEQATARAAGLGRWSACAPG